MHSTLSEISVQILYLVSPLRIRITSNHNIKLTAILVRELRKLSFSTFAWRASSSALASAIRVTWSSFQISVSRSDGSLSIKHRKNDDVVFNQYFSALNFVYTSPFIKLKLAMKGVS